VQEEWEAEDERNRIAEENAANEELIKDFDDIKVRIEADRLLAEKLQEQEREQFTIEERVKFLHDTIAAQRKFLAELEPKEHKNWLVHKQTACGKDFSNPFMVDNLPKIVGLSTHLASVVKSWLVHDQTVHALASPKANELTIPEQTATGKGTSNPLMAGSLPKTTKPT
ncbi:hypothetical protein Tco_1364757, partial [Tanacetum coccineum]